jgi:hypothetical protein
MGKMSKTYGGLDKEFRLPKNLSEERKKLVWLHNKLREVLENNSFSKVKADNLKQYTIALEEAIDYILGIGDYRKLTNEARRIVMFLLSIRKAWSLTPKLIHKKPEEIFKFLNIDLLPDIRKQIILDFINEKGRQKRKIFQDWEIKILSKSYEELNNIQAMYMIGRTYDSIYSFRNHRNHIDEIRKYGKQYRLTHPKQLK